MAFGRFGVVATVANTDTTTYTVPANCSYAEVNIDILNNDPLDASLKVALSTSTTPTATEYIEDGAVVPSSGGILSRTGLVLSPGENVVVNSSLTGTIVRISGKEVLR